MAAPKITSRYDRNEGDRSVVIALVRLNRRKEEIASTLGISVKLLQKYYPDELLRLDESKYIPNDIDRDLVFSMSAFGYTQEQISKRLHVSIERMREHYRDELDHAFDTANIEVAKNLKRIATGNSPQALGASIFWLRCRARWSDKPAEEMVSAEDLAMRVRESLAAMDQSTGANDAD